MWRRQGDVSAYPEAGTTGRGHDKAAMGALDLQLHARLRAFQHKYHLPLPSARSALSLGGEGEGQPTEPSVPQDRRPEENRDPADLLPDASFASSIASSCSPSAGPDQLRELLGSRHEENRRGLLHFYQAQREGVEEFQELERMLATVDIGNRDDGGMRVDGGSSSRETLSFQPQPLSDGAPDPLPRKLHQGGNSDDHPGDGPEEAPSELSWTDRKQLCDESFHPLLGSGVQPLSDAMDDVQAPGDGEAVDDPWVHPPPAPSSLMSSLFGTTHRALPDKMRKTKPAATAAAAAPALKGGPPSVSGPPASATTTIPLDKAAEIASLQDQVKRLLAELSASRAKEAHRVADFEAFRTAELARIQEMQEAAAKSVRQERSLWERQRKAAEALPTKRERAELEAIKAQIVDIQSDFRDEKARLLLTQDRFRKKVEELKRRNAELLDQVKVLERERSGLLEAVQGSRAPVSAVRERAATRVGSTAVPRTPAPSKAADAAPALAPQGRHSRSLGPITAIARPSPQSPAPPPPTAAAADDRGASRPPAGREKRAGRIIERMDPSSWALEDLQIQLALPPHFEANSHGDGRAERRYADGTCLCHHPNGSIKESRPDGTHIIHFSNGDTREIQPNGNLHYWYAAQNTLHSTLATEGGLEVLRFADGQVEERYPDGTAHITFPDGTVRYIFASGEEECIFPDGRVEKIEEGRKKVTEFPDGSKETHVNGVRTKHYPNGAMRIVFANGTRETRLPDGRVRIHDRHGNVLCNA